MKVLVVDTLLLTGFLLQLACTLPSSTAFVLSPPRSIPPASIAATASLKSPISGGRTLSRASHTSDRLRAGHSDGAAKEGVSIDVFDALMSGDVAAVKEYVNAGGDCSVQDSIGESLSNMSKYSCMYCSCCTGSLLCIVRKRGPHQVRYDSDCVCCDGNCPRILQPEETPSGDACVDYVCFTRIPGICFDLAHRTTQTSGNWKLDSHFLM